MKTKNIFLALSAIATFGIISAQANKTQTSTPASKKTCFVDVNKNNVCDRSENNICNFEVKRQIDSSRQIISNRQFLRNGNGRRNGNGKGLGYRSNFVDANNNGVCDNNEATK